MSLINVTKTYHSKEACWDKLELMRWPNGVCCIKCGVTGEDEKGNPRIMKFTTSESTRERVSKKTGKVRTVSIPARRLYECKDCGYQFSVTAGTIFHDSHLPLWKWLLATYTMAEAKKGAAQVQEKVEDVQLRRKADGLAKEIGYLVVKQKGGDASAAGEIDRLVAEIGALEEQIAADESPQAEASGG